MIKSQTEIEETLKDPTNKKIIQDYISAENKRMYENVYSLVEKRYPSLKNIFEGIREEVDPITNLEKIKSQIKGIDFTVEEKKFTRLDLDLLVISGKIKEENKELQKLLRMIDKAQDIYNSYEESIPTEEQFYNDTIQTIKEIALSDNIEPEVVAKGKNYGDEITRRVFSIRDKAEDYLDKWLDVLTTSLYDIRKFADFVKKEGGTIKKLAPTPKAIEALRTKTLEYKTQEFNRIFH